MGTDLLWFGLVGLLLGVGGVHFYVGVHDLLVAFLTGMDMLVGREAVELDRSFNPYHPWRYLGRAVFFTVGGGGAVLLALMIVVGAFGIAPYWWYRYVVGK